MSTSDAWVGSPGRFLTDQQRHWAEHQGVELDSKGWATRYADNLYQRCHPESLQELITGGEVSEDGRSGRIAAPHSSSALSVNMFDFWRYRDPRAFGLALGTPMTRFDAFEQKHSTGLARSPQLDAEFAGADGLRVGVEVKFREPYGAVRNQFSDAYFTTSGMWDRLPSLRRHARDINSGRARYGTLHAAQLIKHCLGLRRSYGHRFMLLYLWHYVPSDIGDQHRSEILQLSRVLASEVLFVSVTTQDVLARFEPTTGTRGWYEYMRSRYSAPGGFTGDPP